MISGETGVGKEVVAAMLHDASPRRPRPFVTVNCAALPDELIESEFFGHTRGSFTDAHRDKIGLAALADGGTLFLDEVGEMSPRMQAVLLRFTENREIHPVGSTRRDAPVNARIIAATNRDLAARVASGDFRQDLYYRLNVIHIPVPPLRERGSDIVLLFEHFLQDYAERHGTARPSLAPATIELLLAHTWPGNVREVKNVAERLVIEGYEHIDPDALPSEMRRTKSWSPAGPAALHDTPMSSIEVAWNEMVIDGKSFWLVVHPRFIDRELTKTDVRNIIRRGLEETQGNYRKLTALFNIAPSDYKRFLAFLYQHDCHLAFHRFRAPGYSVAS